MRIMTGLASAVDSRLMASPFSPITIDFVAVQTKLWPFLQQVNRLIIAMRMMTDSTVLVGRWSFRLDLLRAVTLDAKLAGSPGEQERLLTAMRIMAKVTAPLDKGRVPARQLPLSFDRPMATAATLGAVLDKQLRPLRPMRVMAGRAAAGNKGAVQAWQHQRFADQIMTIGADPPLLLDENPPMSTFMREMTAEAVTALCGLVIDPATGGVIGMTIEAKLIARFAQQRRLSRSGQVWRMAGQTIALSCRRVRITGSFCLGIRTEAVETMAFEAKLLRQHLQHAGLVTGMHLMAAGALSVHRRRVRSRGLVTTELLRMTALAQLVNFGANRERRRAGARLVAVLAGTVRHRPVHQVFQHFLIFGGMNVVTVTATTGHRIASVLSDKRAAGDIMAILAQGGAILDQQLGGR